MGGIANDDGFAFVPALDGIAVADLPEGGCWINTITGIGSVREFRSHFVLELSEAMAARTYASNFCSLCGNSENFSTRSSALPLALQLSTASSAGIDTGAKRFKTLLSRQGYISCNSSHQRLFFRHSHLVTPPLTHLAPSLATKLSILISSTNDASSGSWRSFSTSQRHLNALWPLYTLGSFSFPVTARRIAECTPSAPTTKSAV